MKNIFLAADVGASKTALALISPELGPDRPLRTSTVTTAKYASFEDLVDEFLTEVDYAVEHAIFAVAGPVLGGRVTATISHLPWEMDGVRIQQNLQLKSLELINDLEAIAQAIPHLVRDDLHTLNTGYPEPYGTLAIIAPGTGLGEAFLLWNGNQYQARVSEGGQASFASTTPFEFDLLRYIQREFGFASYETVCSGMGLQNIYGYLKEIGYADEPAWLAKQLSTAKNPTPIIIDNALNKDASSKLCRATIQTFVTVLGAEAGNLALKVMATGGVYLAGGIPRRILPLLEEEKERFLSAFSNKGIMTEMMIDVPVHVITNQRVALLGMAQRILTNPTHM